MSDLTPEQRAEQLLERAQIKNYPHLKGLYMPILPAVIDAFRAIEQATWEKAAKLLEEDSVVEPDWFAGTAENLARLRERLLTVFRRRATQKFSCGS